MKGRFLVNTVNQCAVTVITITSGQSNLTKGRIAAAHGRLNRIRQPRHPSRRRMHEFIPGNAITAPAAVERICLREG